MKGWIVSIWIDAPDQWEAHAVKNEITRALDVDVPLGAPAARLSLRTVYTPKSDERKSERSHDG